MVARIAAVAVLVSALFAAPASAGKLKPFHGLSSRGGIVFDGSRWVAYGDLSGDTIVLDEKRGTRLRIGALPDCEGSILSAIGGARVAIECPVTNEALIVSATDGSVRRRISLGPGKFGDSVEGVEVVAIGSRRVELAIYGHGGSSWLNLADWHQAGPGTNEDAFPDTTVPALAGAAATTPMCAPLHRWPAEDLGIDGPEYANYQYDAPWGLTTRGQQQGVWLEHCGTTEARKLCSTCSGGWLGAGYATWAEGRYAYALRLRDGRLFKFKMTRATGAVPAGRTLFTYGTMPGSAGHWFVGTLPR